MQLCISLKLKPSVYYLSPEGFEATPGEAISEEMFMDLGSFTFC